MIKNKRNEDEDSKENKQQKKSSINSGLIYRKIILF